MERAKVIQELIKKTGLSTKAFSEKAGIPYTTLRSMLTRGVGGASVDNVLKVCKVLGITTDELNRLAFPNSDLEHEYLQGDLFALLKPYMKGPLYGNQNIIPEMKLELQREIKKHPELNALDFEYTNDGIAQLLSEKSDISFTRNFIRIVESAIANTNKTAIEWSNSRIENDLKKIMMNPNLEYEGQLISESERQRILAMLRLMLTDYSPSDELLKDHLPFPEN
ncbi:helix-turn-helix domain-containing protein [Paenibacillus sp. y28]|uniref:helix-turn-helix domain-containing protein n=1 Tax=Paenibacillus sp. y28 TaxID=3129110 RepID=UPI0030188322